jgi:type I restriction enzyme S subunit
MAKYKAYPEYKDSGIEWLGVFPSHWEILSAKRMFQSVRTPAYKSDEQLAASQKYGVIPQSLMMQLNDSKVMLALKGTESFRHVEANNFVISLRSFEGGIEYSQYTGCVSPAYTVLKNTKPISYGYYRYLLKCMPFIAALQSSTDSLRDGKSINYEQFSALSLPLSSVQEQNVIAAFLDHETAKIDNLIEKQQQLIELLKEKRQAVISHAVTKGLNPDVPMKDSGVEWLGEIPSHWEMKRLGYLGCARNGLTYSPENITDQESGVLVLRSSNIQNASLCFDDNVYVNRSIPEHFLVKENDLLICSRNGSRNLIGKNALISKDAEGMAFGAFMAIFRSQINTYIFWVLNSPLFDYQSGSFLTSTINQLTIGNLNSMEIPVPTFKEQKEIVQYLSEKNHDFIELINKVNNSIALLQERRAALISAAVTGKIDVRDWVAPDTQDVEEPQEATT